jgi:putative sugar O-methyltransferase
MESPIKKSLFKAFRNPSLALLLIKARLHGLIGSKEFSGANENRSESDNGRYVSFVNKANNNFKAFKTFKRNPSYVEILEHASKEDGLSYLKIIADQTPDLLNKINDFKINDLVGNPIIHHYDGIGRVSPSTLRYAKVASDLMLHFGQDIGKNIAEIGIGYGGQMLINDQVFKMKSYHLFDLSPVLMLASRYLENHILNASYELSTLNQSAGDLEYDLVISNYAFSELPQQLQKKYIEKVLSKSKKGYLTMNSGHSDSAFSQNKLSLSQLEELLPKFRVFEEKPLTSAKNYIIVWG